MRTVLFVPGFKESIESRDYLKILQAIDAKGYKTKFVAIKWLGNTVFDWVNEFEESYRKYEPEDIVLAGFSYGAIVALLTASRRNPSELWLFSLSARFHEDFPNLDKLTLKTMAKSKRRLKAFKSLYFSDLSSNIKCRTVIFIGEKESENDPALMQRAKEANKRILGSKLIYIPKAPHDISDTNYVAVVKKYI